MKTRFLLFFFLLSVSIFSEEFRFVLNTGHSGSSYYLQYDENTHYAVSVSDEGEILLFAVDTQRVIKKYTLSHNTIVDLKFNPEFSEIAFVTYANLHFTLEVWDWHRGVRLFSRELQDKPLFLEYTMAGKNLAIGQSDIPSIIFLDHQNGREKDWLKNHSSLYQDVYVGSSESNIMTYNLSGQINYIRLDNGQSLGSVKTEAGLEWLDVLQTGRKNLALGKKSNDFYILDRQTGSIMDRFSQDRILSMDLDCSRALLSLVVDIRGNTFLKQYDLQDGLFNPVDEPLLLTRDKDITSITSVGELTLIGTGTGDFFNFYNETEEFIPLFEEQELPFVDLQFFDDALYISSPERMIRLDSPYLKANSTLSDIERVKQTNQIYPNRGLFHFYHEGEKLFAFSSDSNQPAPLLLANDEGLLERMPVMGDKLLSGDHFTFSDNLFLFMDQSSNLNLYDISSGENLFQWSSPSIESFCFVTDETLLIGKASSPQKMGVLEILNRTTGEIAPLNDTYFYILDLQKTEKGIYILGLKMIEGEVYTELSIRDPENINESVSLLTVASEDYNSKMFLNDRNLFISLQGIGLLYFNGSRSHIIETPYDIVDLTFMDDKMVVLYKGNKLSFWSLSPFREDLEMNFFSDYSWLAVSPEQNAYYYTPEARDNFFVYRVIRR